MALLNSRPLLWLILAIPGAWVLGRWATGSASYGEAVSESGVWAARLFIVTLAVTPVRLMFKKARWPAWWVRRRRDLGVATFAYAAGHTVIYSLRKKDVSLMVQEGAEPWLAAGWVALAILIALAATSNNALVRMMGRGWKWLHRLAYLAAVLTFVHWVLSAFEPLSAYIHLAALAMLEVVRIALQVRQRVT